MWYGSDVCVVQCTCVLIALYQFDFKFVFVQIMKGVYYVVLCMVPGKTHPMSIIPEFL